MTKIVNGHSIKINMADSRRNLNLKYVNFALLAVIMIMGSFYLVNINHLTVQGFVLRNLKTQVAELQSNNLDKEEAVNQAQSYNALTARTPELNMVAIGNVEYLAASNLAMARK
ncbi:hypothetical protein GW920_00835 [Candidatus Falkowbacteria bacterium]|uniref:Uncharacterized protein n=1 Tax=Candidatus Falkowbacteria bacterium CG10_big_fil_rev_8_21_14_0_10_37_18 TaxID=1974562 RepID=A0A2H0V967_9BACT|nr:hypothetical protein [Candidatus Falkowbacteria bacterium]NCQ12672.1 hypothetical protein [Candidatus Falkowbacteria bacterium]OIO06236.1 MAG: hypothetical protein AUJ26_01265 [Candidatus Falkowbacteria bacterium CG1_02_37_21]PIR95638.1 MAG: hypothetical protein COT93_01245 [Candidatus Falkowbacteria bacterium CG10_big_fil_rev_8_21_14_0_10_37_18]